MKRLVLVLLALVPGLANALTLAEAERVALEKSPALAAAVAERDAAAARVVTARTFPHNPRLGAEAGPRLGPDGTTADWGLSLQQTIELGGQHRGRQHEAVAELRRAEVQLALVRGEVRAGVRLAYLDAVEARERLRLIEAEVTLAETLVSVTERRFSEGATARIEVNLARAELGRARARVEQARMVYEQGCLRLGEAAGLLDVGEPEQAAPTPDDPLLPPATGPLPPLRRLLDDTFQRRPDWQLAMAELGAAAGRALLAEASATPDLDLGAFVRREANRETIAGLSLEVPLPVFDRKQGPRAEAEALRSAARPRADEAMLREIREVRAAVIEAERTAAAAELLAREVLPPLEENTRLLTQGVEAGKLAPSDLLPIRQQMREAAVEHITALAAAQRARIRLDLATGILGPAPEPLDAIR